MLNLDPIKERLAAVDGMQTGAYREFLHYAAQDVEALVAEVEQLREWHAEDRDTLDELARRHGLLHAAIRKHRDGWYRSENSMLVDRVVKRAAQARELWAVLDA